jgi:hypothetical protein
MGKQQYIGILFMIPKIENDTMELPAIPVLPNTSFKVKVQMMVEAFATGYSPANITKKNIRSWDYIKYCDNHSEVTMYVPYDITDPFAITTNIRNVKTMSKVILYNPTVESSITIYDVLMLIVLGVVLGMIIAERTSAY